MFDSSFFSSDAPAAARKAVDSMFCSADGALVVGAHSGCFSALIRVVALLPNWNSSGTVSSFFHLDPSQEIFCIFKRRSCRACSCRFKKLVKPWTRVLFAAVDGSAECSRERDRWTLSVISGANVQIVFSVSSFFSRNSPIFCSFRFAHCWLRL